MRRIWSRVTQRGFARGFWALAGATLGSQVVVVAVAPILSRLYSPEEFGYFGIFVMGVVLLGLIGSMRYELALPIARTEPEARAILVLCGLCVLIVTGLFSGAVATWELARGWGRSDVDAFTLGAWMVAALAFNVAGTLEYWCVRRGALEVNGIARVVFVVTQGTVQVLCGIAGWTAHGLVTGFVVSQFARLTFTASRVDAWAELVREPPNREELVEIGKTYWRFPAFAAPSSLMWEAVQLAPVGLLAAIYDTYTAGLFGFAQRILEAPVRLLSYAASLAFLSEARTLSPSGVRRLFAATVVRFVILGVLGLGPIIVIGPELFAIVFGRPWREAGEIAQWLVPFQLARFVAGAGSNVLTLYQRTDLQLVAAAVACSALVIGFCGGWLFGWSAQTSILVFAWTGATGYVIQLTAAGLIARGAREANRE